MKTRLKIGLEFAKTPGSKVGFNNTNFKSLWDIARCQGQINNVIGLLLFFSVSDE